jgi:hypothetical protein
MSEEKRQSQAVPFFARYLENQLSEDVDHLRDLSEEEIEAVTGGIQAVTLKFPSDSEDGHGHGPMTKKYPSDKDELAQY